MQPSHVYVRTDYVGVRVSVCVFVVIEVLDTKNLESISVEKMTKRLSVI